MRADDEVRAGLERQYREQIELISKAITVDGELESSVLVNEFRNALKKDADEAVKAFRLTDIDDKVTLRAIQLRISMHQYLEDLIGAIDKQHKNAATRVMQIEKDISYEPEN